MTDEAVTLQAFPQAGTLGSTHESNLPVNQTRSFTSAAGDNAGSWERGKVRSVCLLTADLRQWVSRSGGYQRWRDAGSRSRQLGRVEGGRSEEDRRRLGLLPF